MKLQFLLYFFTFLQNKTIFYIFSCSNILKLVLDNNQKTNFSVQKWSFLAFFSKVKFVCFLRFLKIGIFCGIDVKFQDLSITSLDNMFI